MNVTQIWEILREGGPITQILILVTFCGFVAAVVFCARGVPLSRFAVVTYSCPAVAAIIGFASHFHSLGNNLGLFHGYIYELRPSFAEAFIRLYLGVFVSVFLLFVATLFHAFYLLRDRSHATQPSVA